MKLMIYSRIGIEQRSRLPFADHTALISISDPDMLPPSLHCKPEHCLFLSFDDITPEEAIDRLELPPLTGKALDLALKQRRTFLFTDEMAERTAAFIMERTKDTRLLICQCEQGQSRSAAFAAAIKECLWHNGQEIFDNPRYAPNRFVYQKLGNALLKRHAPNSPFVDKENIFYINIR